MFHAFDNAVSGQTNPRAEWMAVLARAPVAMLEQALHAHHTQRQIEWLRKPETGLYMVQGRAGGTGERFNVGEVTVTRCALRIVASEKQASPVGVAYVLGRHLRHAELAALADALLQESAQHDALQQSLLTPVRQHLALQSNLRQGQVQSTKVDFFTVAREAGGSDDTEEDA
jgi:alpha-D-ribose 1-methylphosphonate 5-triphosphate synthase subunit PhnG